MKNKQQGFSIPLLILMLVVLGIGIGIGVFISTHQTDADKTVTIPAPVHRRDGKSGLPDAPYGGKTDGAPGITERGDRPERGGMPRESHR